MAIVMRSWSSRCISVIGTHLMREYKCLRIEIKTADYQGDVATRLLGQFDELIDRVRRRAYELFEQRGGQHGGHLEDWLRAEEELSFPAKFTVEEDPGSFNLRMSLPGFKGKDLQVNTWAIV